MNHLEDPELQYPNLIAIVDDEEEVRLSTRTLLRSYGIQALAFESAKSFLEGPDLSTVDCLITDVQMPGMDGAALLDALGERGARFPVIVISALDSEQTRAIVLAKGADAFLPKPVDPDDLMGWLERLQSAR